MLTGGDVARAVGTFNYTANPDGTVNPDPTWIAQHIRTEMMPIIGRVTGNVVMLPQLRGALSQVVREGLSKAIYTYDGCYVPRFIARIRRGADFHTFGTAIDLNARDNYRGIAGKMDRQRRHHLQAVGLRLGRRLELHRSDALRAGPRWRGRPDLSVASRPCALCR